MKHYHNTTGETENLKEYEKKAKTQDEKILAYMESKHPAKTFFAPAELLQVLPNAPITSIRRALSNLTKKGKLTKTKVKRLGLYNKKECTWMLKNNIKC